MRRIMLFAFALLTSCSTTSVAAQRVWVSEFATTRVEAQAPIAQLPSLINQLPFDLSTGPKASAPLNVNTRYIRIICEVKCAINAKGVTATVNDLLIPPLVPEYFGVQPGANTVINAIVVP